MTEFATDSSTWTVVLCDSLEKVLPTVKPREFNPQIPLVGFRGETASFQVAVFHSSGGDLFESERVRISLGSVAGVRSRVSSVELVAVEYPAPPGADEHYLAHTPAVLPDLLVPAAGEEIIPLADQWRAAWVDLVVDPDAVSTEASIPVRVSVGDYVIAELTVPVLIRATTLPPLDIPNSQWFHCDGLAEYYGLEVFGEQHWAVIDRFLAAARDISTNAILTPVWTPPLDTGVGHYRLTTQLVGITDANDDAHYEFDFTLLKRWMELCRSHGFRYLEIAHLFTQWGAKATPAIYVQSHGQLERRFGWDVASTDPRYRRFLEQLLPELKTLLEAEWGLENILFHISDEPTQENADGYAAARSSVVDLLVNCTIVDAISDLSLYETGLVPHPIVATDHAGAFLDAGVRPWLYYCVAQATNVANRFIALPSTRNRVIAAQLFKFEARGFLHWGFNFYNSARSLTAIDPFRDNCANRAFLGGDPFLVYPGPGGVPLESIRFRVFAEAMNDLRAMQLVRDQHGVERTLEIVDPTGSLALDDFSYDADHYRHAFHALALLCAE